MARRRADAVRQNGPHRRTEVAVNATPGLFRRSSARYVRHDNGPKHPIIRREGDNTQLNSLCGNHMTKLGMATSNPSKTNGATKNGMIPL